MPSITTGIRHQIPALIFRGFLLSCSSREEQHIEMIQNIKSEEQNWENSVLKNMTFPKCF
jgi:hypothetical protein